MNGARRTSIFSMSGDIGVNVVDPAEHVRVQELVMVGEMPLNARPNSSCCYLPRQAR
ncbi:MAG: hypothetical protein QOE74_4174 [Mycobacterium sp.]|nr:hypothetical protein [Mycobacterium sp.]